MSKKNTPKFVIQVPDEETHDYFIDGEHVGTITHDDAGWSGMQVVDNIFEGVAAHFGTTAETIEVEED